jgi:hypothetical protein
MTLPSWFILIEEGGFIFFRVGIFFPDLYFLLIKRQIPVIFLVSSEGQLYLLAFYDIQGYADDLF